METGNCENFEECEKDFLEKVSKSMNGWESKRSKKEKKIEKVGNGEKGKIPFDLSHRPAKKEAKRAMKALMSHGGKEIDEGR